MVSNQWGGQCKVRVVAGHESQARVYGGKSRPLGSLEGSYPKHSKVALP